ncbi:MAG TPA: hypothetical protein VG101_19380, partial [Puia sp.]|nr:hypothetical protein [Puia sp.]
VWGAAGVRRLPGSGRRAGGCGIIGFGQEDRGAGGVWDYRVRGAEFGELGWAVGSAVGWGN